MERFPRWLGLVLLYCLKLQTSQACVTLTAPTNGAMTCTNGFNDGSTCTFTCNTWYVLAGSSSSSCVVDVWSNNEPVCNPTEGTLQLMFGTTTRGTLEIYHSGAWGSICHDGFTDTSATIACNQLGLGSVGIAFKDAYFGSSTSGTIWVSNVACAGTEADLISCPKADWSAHTCTSNMDVGIECLNSYSYRLIDGPTPNTGRVEMLAAGVWMSVCDNGFDINAANVTCNKLGYSGASSVQPGGTYGMSSGVIRYVNVVCAGSETDLAQCQHQVGDDGVCTHSNDVGVTCQGGPMRLVTNTANNNEGTIELYHAGQWGTLYGSYPPDDNIAKVVCNHLGFGYIGYTTSYYYHGQHSSPRLLNSITCLGNETNLVECQHTSWTSTGSYSYGAGAFCKPFDVTDVRLVGGSVPWEGRVEINVDGVWGTVCDDDWDLVDAHVFCRMLGYPKGATNAWRYAHFGAGSGTILADDLYCTGTETNILQCPFTKGDGHNCSPSEDSSLKCDADIRCAYTWQLPDVSQFIMRKTEEGQSNYTIIESMTSLNDMLCTRLCSAHARENCGEYNECSMVKYDDVTSTCSLYHRTNVTSPVVCDAVTPCFLAVDMF